VAHDKGVQLASVTLPVTVLFWAEAVAINSIRTPKSDRNFLICSSFKILGRVHEECSGYILV